MDTYKSVVELDLSQAAAINSRRYKGLMITSSDGTGDDIVLKIVTATNETVELDFHFEASGVHGFMILPLFVIKVFLQAVILYYNFFLIIIFIFVNN